MNALLRRIAFLPLFIVLLAPAARAQQPPTLESPGTARVQVVDQRWTDAARDRTLPIRLRVPDVVNTPGARPVILFSHGLGGALQAGTLWAEHWASHGFVVVHLQHPGSDESVWKAADSRAEAARAMKRAADPKQLQARIEDVKFVLDELARRQRAGDPLAQRMDLSRIGMSGHSFGAATTQMLAGQRPPVPRRLRAAAETMAEPRLIAFIALSPSARSEDAASQFTAITRPFFSITGTADGKVGMGLGVEPALRLLPFEGMPGPDQYLLNLDRADHAIFSGQPRWQDQDKSDPALDELHRRQVKTLSTAFWLAHLANDAQARQWLAREAAGYVGRAGAFSAK